LLAWHGSRKCTVATSTMAIPHQSNQTIRTDAPLYAFVMHFLDPIVVGVSTYEMGSGPIC
jgi:hypothetical protein